MTGRAARRHPESVPVDPAECESPSSARGADLSLRGRAGGYATAAKLSAEERSASARKAVQARWDREAERRAAAGEPPLKKTRALLSDQEKAFYLAKVDEAFGAGYPWRHPSDRPRQAEKLARADAAKAAAAAFREMGRDS